MITKKFGTGKMFLTMFLVCMAFMPAASAEEAVNVVENAKDGYVGILSPILYIDISGDLSQPSNTVLFYCTVWKGLGQSVSRCDSV